METSIILDVLAANALTLALFYGAWRIKRDERDIGGMMYALFPLVVICLLAYSSILEREARQASGLAEAPQAAPQRSAEAEAGRP